MPKCLNICCSGQLQISLERKQRQNSDWMTDMYMYIYIICAQFCPFSIHQDQTHSTKHSPKYTDAPWWGKWGMDANLGANNQMCYSNYLVARQCSDSPLLSTESPTDAAPARLSWLLTTGCVWPRYDPLSCTFSCSFSIYLPIYLSNLSIYLI